MMIIKLMLFLSLLDNQLNDSKEVKNQNGGKLFL